MAFNQLIFICLFLPLSVLIYRVVPQKARKVYLILVSLLFVAWGNLSDLLYLCTVIGFNFFTAKQMDRLKKDGQAAPAKFVFISGLAVDILFLGYFKYYDFFRSLFGLSKASFGIAVPLGISFVTFSLISFLCDVYREKEEVPRFLDFVLYITFFPKITSGPIVSFHEFTKMLENVENSRQNRNIGLEQFITGLAKKTLLAGNLSILFTAVSTAAERSTLEAWLGALAYTFMLYFDFSGYSDMAIGLGKLFGYTMPQNFDHPYTALNITDFWRKWHMTLGAFFKNYVYIPLGGNRKGEKRTILNLFVVFLLTGIWHGANFTFIVWGIYHFIFNAADKLFLDKAFKKVPRLLRSFLTFFVVMIGWVFFFSDSLGDAFRYLGNMLGIGTGGSAGGYYLSSFLILLLVSAFLSLPVMRNIITNIKRKKLQYYFPVHVIVLIVIFLLCVASMVSDTYTSFLYAAF
ncbi:MAG: MBOAT family protein [Ruminococcaceae bacterium]|nr:MBOAT family protein [Oscillospiraceae bacterium]